MKTEPATSANGPIAPASKAVTYASYLALDELLRLQRPKSEPNEPDEHLFIVIHQVYELWFKQVLIELEQMFSALRRDDEAALMHGFKRVLTIFKTLVAQVDVLETMTPISFASFRSRLETASGFQSYQFRVIESLLGKRSPHTLVHFASDPLKQAELQRIVTSPSLWDEFLHHLARRGFSIPISVLSRDYSQPIVSSAEVQAALLKIYRESNALTSLCERLVDLDEGLQEWRYRHVKMVERTIGFKIGTGGSSGAEYLRSTLFSPLFVDLWGIRSQL